MPNPDSPLLDLPDDVAQGLASLVEAARQALGPDLIAIVQRVTAAG